MQWGPRSIDILLEAAARWPRAGALGPLIRDPDGSVYPSARHLPSLIRGGMHAVVGPFWNPTRGPRPTGRSGRSPANVRSAGCRVRACCCGGPRSIEVVGFDERYFMYMEDVDLGDRLGRAGWQNVYVPSAEILHDKGHSTGRDPARNLAAHHTSTYTFLADRYPRWWQAPLRWTIRAALRCARGSGGPQFSAQAGERTALSVNPAEVDAVILVGGLGTRLRPLTLSAPKPMLPTAGLPFLTHLLSRIAAAGIEHVVLGTSYKAAVFESEFGDGSKLGLQIDYVVEDEPLGTGGGIANVASKLRHRHRAGVQRRRAVRRGPVRAAGVPRGQRRRRHTAPGAGRRSARLRLRADRR